MIDSDTKKFINEMIIGASDEFRAILTDFCGGMREMQESQNEKLDEIVQSLDFIADKLP